MDATEATAVTAPPRWLDPEALFDEARRHRRRRRSRLAIAALVLLALASVGYALVASLAASPNGSGSAGPAIGASAKPVAIVLLVDVSGSMQADDVHPTRLAAIVAALQAFVRGLPDKLKVGLVEFSQSALVLQQPTRDRKQLLAALRTLHPLMAGTALGSGLQTALKLAVDALRQMGIRPSAGHLLPAAILLESDGAQTEPGLSPFTAASHAKNLGIRVDAVALGTAHGVVTQRSGAGRMIQINTIPVPPDPQTVAQVAHVTGGRAYDAPTDASLSAAYRDLTKTLGG